MDETTLLGDGQRSSATLVGEADEADGPRVCCHGVRQLGARFVLPGRQRDRFALRHHDQRLERVAGAGLRVARVNGDPARRAAQLRPIGDLAGKDLGDLTERQRADGVLRRDEDQQAVERDHGFMLCRVHFRVALPRHLLLLFGSDGPRQHGDIGAAFRQGRYPRMRPIRAALDGQHPLPAPQAKCVVARLPVGHEAFPLAISLDEGRHQPFTNGVGAEDAKALIFADGH